jgi:hypothetical protein
MREYQPCDCSADNYEGEQVDVNDVRGEPERRDRKRSDNNPRSPRFRNRETRAIRMRPATRTTNQKKSDPMESDSFPINSQMVYREGRRGPRGINAR